MQRKKIFDPVRLVQQKFERKNKHWRQIKIELINTSLVRWQKTCRGHFFFYRFIFILCLFLLRESQHESPRPVVSNSLRGKIKSTVLFLNLIFYFNCFYNNSLYKIKLKQTSLFYSSSWSSLMLSKSN